MYSTLWFAVKQVSILISTLRFCMIDTYFGATIIILTSLFIIIKLVYKIRKETLWQAWRSPASLLTHRVRGCHEIDHLKEFPFICMLSIPDLFLSVKDFFGSQITVPTFFINFHECDDRVSIASWLQRSTETKYRLKPFRAIRNFF